MGSGEKLPLLLHAALHTALHAKHVELALHTALPPSEHVELALHTVHAEHVELGPALHQYGALLQSWALLPAEPLSQEVLQ